MEKLKRWAASLLAVVMLLTLFAPASTALALELLTDDVTVLTSSKVGNGVMKSTITCTQNGQTVTGGAGEEVANLFDLDENTKFYAKVVPTADAPLIISWQMYSNCSIKTIALTTANDANRYSARNPVSWTFSGSEDGVTWTDLDSREQQLFDASYQTKYYTFPCRLRYTYYRISFTSNNGGTGFQLADLQLSVTQYSQEQDADVMDAAAAGKVVNAITDLGTAEEANFSVLTVDAVVAARSAYNQLNSAAKAMVTNYDSLLEWEIYLDTCTGVPAVITAIARVGSAIASGAYDYHLNGDISAAQEAYRRLSSQEQAQVTNYSVLTNAAEAMRSINDAFFVTVSGWDQSESATQTPWMIFAGESEQAATLAAVADEFAYEYRYNGYLLSSATDFTLTGNWNQMMCVQVDTRPNDNLGNPWGQDRKWAAVVSPYIGTAFSIRQYIALAEGSIPLSNQFQVDGVVYQQFKTILCSYPADLSETSLQRVSIYPGFDGSTDITNGLFSYTYALYNQREKWNGKTLGYPTGPAVAADNLIYQKFLSADGEAYLVTAATTAAAADRNVPDEGAYVVTGETLETLLTLGAGFFRAIQVTGMPLQNEDNGIQRFQYGTVSSGVFTSSVTDRAVLDAVYAIAAISDPVTLADDALIRKARAVYDALSQTQKTQVYNQNVLVSAEQDYLVAVDQDAAQKVLEQFEALPVDSDIDGDALLTVKTAVNEVVLAYEALTAAQQGYLPADFAAALYHKRDIAAGGGYYTYVEGAKGDAVKAQIAALGTITSLEQAPAVQAVRQAYDALTQAQKAYVTNLSVLEAAETVVARLQLTDHTPYVTAEDVTVSPETESVKLQISLRNAVDLSGNGTLAGMQLRFVLDPHFTLTSVTTNLGGGFQVYSNSNNMILLYDDEAKGCPTNADFVLFTVTLSAKGLTAGDSYTVGYTVVDCCDSAATRIQENIVTLSNSITVTDGLLGDMNQDGKLSVTDVVLLRKAILSGTMETAGDMNQDGHLSVTDVVLLRKAILTV